MNITIHKTVDWAIHELNPQAYNPNKQTPEEFEALKQSIREHGFLDPLVIRTNGDIIGGHHRVRALKEICVEDGVPPPKVPCIVLDVDDVTAKKLNLKLNHIKGSPDARLLGELLVDIFPLEQRALPTFQNELGALGFVPDLALKHIELIEPLQTALTGPAEEVRTFGKSVTLTLEFANVSKRDAFKKILQNHVEMEKKKSGDIVADYFKPKPLPKAAPKSKVRK